jgi:hypothetical protein
MNTATQAQTQQAQRVIIQGVTSRGQTFRPRDWAERLCGCLVTVGPGRRQQFNPHVYISYSYTPGVKSLVVEPELQQSNPKAYDFLLAFASDNNLHVSAESMQEQMAIAVGQ